MTVGELRERIGASEFVDWMVLEELEPYGEKAEWYRAGMIACVILNSRPGLKKGDKLFTPDDFIPKIDTRSAFEKAEQERKAMVIWAKVHNAKVEARLKRAGNRRNAGAPGESEEAGVQPAEEDANRRSESRSHNRPG